MQSTKKQTTKPPVLRVNDVTFRGKRSHSMRLTDASFSLRSGELILLQHERGERTRDMASMLQGLSSPLRGEIFFQDQRWSGTDYARHFAMRSKIGRVFDGPAWVQNANVMENVTLASRHHGTNEKRLRNRYRDWIERLEITDVSRERPAFVEPSVLQIYQWIRAFLNRPALLILERPMQLVSSRMMPKLADAVNELRRTGAAVLWMSSTAVSETDLVHPTLTLRTDTGRLIEVTGDGDE